MGRPLCICVRANVCVSIGSLVTSSRRATGSGLLPPVVGPLHRQQWCSWWQIIYWCNYSGTKYLQLDSVMFCKGRSMHLLTRPLCILLSARDQQL